MTMNRVAEITCPQCGEKQDVMIWSTLNVSVNPEEKENLLAGKINFFACSHCDFKSFIPCSFLYHDMENHFVVYYLPEHEIENGLNEDLFTPDGEMRVTTPQIGGSDPDFLDYFKQMRLVFSMMELIRYVRFRERVALFYATGQERAGVQGP